jgi:translocation and assembly module TamB
MKRRRLVALVAVIVFALLGTATVVTVLVLTRTDVGRSKLRSVVVPIIANRFGAGNFYIGNLSGPLINELTIDSIAIRDKHTNELFLSTGRVTVRYDVRDIIDGRIWLRAATVAHPYMHIVQHENGVWNFKEIFASANEPPKPKDEKARGFLNYLVFDSTRVTDGQFLLTMAWSPDEKFKGAARDSVIRVHLTDSTKGVTKREDGFGRTWAWKNAHGLIVHARLVDPDSDVKFGRQFVVDTLSVDEYEPTFKFRKVSAQVRHLGDSVWFEVPHFQLPASSGSGSGKVSWGDKHPVLYDIAIRGDSVALDDVNWVYPPLPRTGGGSVNLQIKNDPANPRILEYKLSKMDVHSTKSHLTGDMSFGAGAPVLLVRNVDLKADPVNFDLLRTINQKPFAQDWQGDLVGTVKGRGGPLTNFVVDDAKAEFRDAHVPGAVSRFTANGELDILYPAFTVFHGFNVDATSLDLRTVEYLFPNFPRLNGFASGVATLDSSWLDVRFSNADMSLVDGPGEPSRLTGSGRITYGADMTYDVTLETQPLSLTMLARSPKVFPMPLRGLVSGPLRARGTTQDLAVQTSLQGTGGALTFDGRVDLDSVGGYGVHGHGEFSALNPATLANVKVSIPPGLLSGHYDVDAAGETWAKTVGSAEIALERTVFDSVRVYESQGHVHFAGGKMTIDSLRLHTAAATLTATGAIGLPNGSPDSISFKVQMDSLGGLRRYLAARDSMLADGEAATAVDSLAGSAVVEGKAAGTMDLLNLRGRLDANNLYINKDRGEHVAVTFDLRNVTDSALGAVHIGIDTVTLAGIELDTIGATFQLSDWRHRRFSGGAASRNGLTALAHGVWNSTPGVDSVTVDSLQLAIGNDRWRLISPANVRRDSTRLTIDSLLLRNQDSASVAFTANVPDTGRALARLRATNVSLREIGLVEQFTDSLTGLANFSVSANGTKLAPEIIADATLTGMRLRGVDVDLMKVGGEYRAGRVSANMLMTRQGRRAVEASASLPATITLFGLREREDSVSGFLNADTTDLSIIKTIVPQLSKVESMSGFLTANVTLSNTWRNKVLAGDVTVTDGSVSLKSHAGITISKINGWIKGSGNAARDSIAVSLHAVDDSKKAPGDLSLTGYVKNLLQTTNTQVFGLKVNANNFHAFNKRSLAEAYVSTAYDSLGRRYRDTLRLTGSLLAPELSGKILVDRGSIFLADRDIARKQSVDLFTDTLDVADSVARTRARTRSALVTALLTNLRTRNATVTLGDVRLKSAEADVKLAGSLNLLTSTQVTRSSVMSGPPFQLEGTLFTTGGSYNLNLGLVQREFQVQQGTVTFDGPYDNPLLNIAAMYNLKRPPDKDLGIIVKLQGPLVPYPGITFSSNSDIEIAQSDLVSYMLTGKPGFDFGANAQTSQVLASFLGPTVSAYTADKLRNTLGSTIDLQFQLGTGQQGPATGFFNSANLSSYLYTSTIGAGRTFGNLSLNVNSGFCQFQNGQGFRAADMLGAEAQYRFNSTYAMRVGYDPGTQARVCNAPSQDLINFVRTPSQFSFSLLQTWRF